ncbi:MAG: alpha-hydroxy acid oxidase [Marmoricola sp.]
MASPWQDPLAARARERLPAPVWQYFATGAREGDSAAEAHAAWSDRRLWPRVLRDVTEVDPSTRLLGTGFRLPFGIAPTSMQRCADPRGELAMAAAAASVGVPHVVSSNAGFPFADIADAGGPWWLQVYLTAPREPCVHVLDAAVSAGASAVVVTVDTPVVGTKYDITDDDFADVDLSWHRCNYPAGVTGGQQGLWATDLTFADLGWLARRTGLPVVVKGVLRPDDARRCVDAGAAAVWVSNHGGRQLDRAVSTAVALPAVAGAVGGEAEVYVDGGLRSGLDLLTALASGADAAFLGRLPLFALAAGGGDRVAAVLRLLGEELTEAMRLSGSADLASVRGLLQPLEGP